MKTTAIAVSFPQVRSWLCLPESLADFVSLMQPRVMLLGVFTAVVGLAIAPDHPDLLRASLAILAIATGADAAGVLNMWYDADINAVMTRTARRPIPRGKISRRAGLRSSPCGCVGRHSRARAQHQSGGTPRISFAAGALPPVIGWAARQA
jgi:heme o synthase